MVAQQYMCHAPRKYRGYSHSQHDSVTRAGELGRSLRMSRTVLLCCTADPVINTFDHLSSSWSDNWMFVQETWLSEKWHDDKECERSLFLHCTLLDVYPLERSWNDCDILLSRYIVKHVTSCDRGNGVQKFIKMWQSLNGPLSETASDYRYFYVRQLCWST